MKHLNANTLVLSVNSQPCTMSLTSARLHLSYYGPYGTAMKE